MPLAAAILVGLLVIGAAGYLWWAGATRPSSILPPGAAARVETPAGPAGAAPPKAAPPSPTVAPPGRLEARAVHARAAAAVLKPAPSTPAAPAPAPTAAPKIPASGAPAANAGTGALRVRSTPAGADVFVEGERRGVTPRDVRGLPYGSYSVRVTRPGYVGQERQVTIDARHRDVPLTFALARVKAAPKPAPKPAPASGKPAPWEPTVKPTAVVVVTSIAVVTRPPARVSGSTAPTSAHLRSPSRPSRPARTRSSSVSRATSPGQHR